MSVAIRSYHVGESLMILLTTLTVWSYTVFSPLRDTVVGSGSSSSSLMIAVFNKNFRKPGFFTT